MCHKMSVLHTWRLSKRANFVSITHCALFLYVAISIWSMSILKIGIKQDPVLCKSDIKCHPCSHKHTHTDAYRVHKPTSRHTCAAKEQITELTQAYNCPVSSWSCQENTYFSSNLRRSKTQEAELLYLFKFRTLIPYPEPLFSAYVITLPLFLWGCQFNRLCLQRRLLSRGNV